MAGVIAALSSDDHVRVLRQHVDNLALAFIAPLGAHQYCICHKSQIKIPEHEFGAKHRVFAHGT
jgi:hypothetical protein